MMTITNDGDDFDDDDDDDDTCDDDDDDVDDEPEQGVRQKHQGDLRQHQVGGLFNNCFQNNSLFIFPDSI